MRQPFRYRLEERVRAHTFLAVLHTWGRELRYHLHVHILVSVGGLPDDGATRMRSKRKRYFVLQSALAAEFRRRFQVGLEHAHLADLLPRSVWTAKKWVANVKLVGSGEQALLYLLRYVFKVAIDDRRIESFDGDAVTYRRVHSTTGQSCRNTPPAHDFIQRYLQHVLPSSFVNVRSYGLWASAAHQKLAAAQSALEFHIAGIGLKPPRQTTITETKVPKSGRHRCLLCGAELVNPPTRMAGGSPVRASVAWENSALDGNGCQGQQALAPARRAMFFDVGKQDVAAGRTLGPIIVIHGNHGLCAREITALLHPEQPAPTRWAPYAPRGGGRFG